MAYDDDQVQTLKPVYLCPCGAEAVMTFAFPGAAKQGRCASHEAGTELRKEIEPGRTYVASVERLDTVPADHQIVDGPRGSYDGWRPGRGS